MYLWGIFPQKLTPLTMGGPEDTTTLLTEAVELFRKRMYDCVVVATPQGAWDPDESTWGSDDLLMLVRAINGL